MSMSQIRKKHTVPARRGMRVSVDGRRGVITSARRGYIFVRFDGLTFSLGCHPTWRVVYFDGDGSTLLDTAAHEAERPAPEARGYAGRDSQ